MNKGAAVLSIRPCKVNKKQTYYEPIWKYGNENHAVRFIKGLFGK